MDSFLFSGRFRPNSTILPQIGQKSFIFLIVLALKKVVVNLAGHKNTTHFGKNTLCMDLLNINAAFRSVVVGSAVRILRSDFLHGSAA
jgi:hypothetical protein